jgi:hypothetical protein
VSETFTFTDLIESESGTFVAAGGGIKEAVTKTATETADSILDGIVPAEWKKPIGKLIERFAEHPEKFENTFLGSLGGKLPTAAPPNQPTQQQTPPPLPPTPPVPASEQPPTPQKQLPDFETIYSNITAGIEKVIDLQGDMPLSEILKELKEETYKPLLKNMYDGWMN